MKQYGSDQQHTKIIILNLKKKKKYKLFVKDDCGNAKTKQIKSLEQCLPLLRGQCSDCFREYSDRAASSSCCSVKDSRASPGKDQECPALACSTVQNAIFLEGGLLWHRRQCI